MKLGLYYWAPENGDWLRDRFVCRLWQLAPVNAPFPPIR
jgi:hypothetical protein